MFSGKLLKDHDSPYFPVMQMLHGRFPESMFVVEEITNHHSLQHIPFNPVLFDSAHAQTAILDMWSSSPEAKHIAIFFKAIPGTTRLQERNLSFVGMAGSFTSTSIGRVEKYWVNDRSSSLDMLASPVIPLEEEDDEAWCPRSPPSCFEPAAAQGCGSDPAGSFGGTGSFGSVFWISFSMMERCFRSPDWAALGPSDFWRPKFSVYIITWCSNCQMFNLLTAVSRFYSCSVGTSQDILGHVSVG